MALSSKAGTVKLPWSLLPPYYREPAVASSPVSIGKEIVPHMSPQTPRKERLRMLKTVLGTDTGRDSKLFEEGKEYDLPMGPHPLPDFGAVALEEGWAEKVEGNPIQPKVEQMPQLKPEHDPDPGAEQTSQPKGGKRK